MLQECRRKRLTYLVKDHLNTPVIPTSRQPGTGASTSSGLDVCLGGDVTFFPSTATTATTKETPESVEKLPGTFVRINSFLVQSTQVVFDSDRRVGSLVGGGREDTPTHEVADHDGGVDGAVALGAAEGADFAAADLAIADDGRVGLRAAAVG